LYALEGDADGLEDPFLAAVPLYVNGFEHDATTGLYLAASRWYDPSSGRFLAPTGSGDGSGYAFVPANPMDLANGFISGGRSVFAGMEDRYKHTVGNEPAKRVED
jgi:RHS repeat-associated protein